MDDKELDLKDIVPEYGSSIGPVRKLFWKRLFVAAKVARLKKGMKVLDLGTGSGNLIRFLNRKLPEKDIYASDFNKNVLQLKKRFPRAMISRQNLLDTSFSDSMFDVVFCLDVLEHIEQLGKASSEISRVMKKEGHLVLSVPKESFLYKLGRFMIKGSFSMETGPGSGKHYYDEKGLVKRLGKDFLVVESIKLKVFGLITLFTIYKLRLKGRKRRRHEKVVR